MAPRAVIWCAVSSQPQAAEDEISLPAQEQEARTFAADQGYQVVDLLAVPGFSRRESDVITALDEFAAQGIFAYHKLREHWQRRDFDVLIAYNHSRLGRSSTLHSYVIENTILAGAQVYLIQGGWIGQDSLRFQIALGGVAATTDVDRLIKARDAKMNQRAAHGLPTTSGVIWSHQVIRNEKGKAVRIAPDETRRPVIDAVGRLLAEGVSWRRIEPEIFARFGYGSPTGKTWYPLKFYYILSSPQFWGHSARFSYAEHRAFSLWVMEEGHTIPDGVLMFYNTHEAFWPPGHSLGDAVRAELRRRDTLARRSLRHTYSFSGLLICGGCGCSLSVCDTDQRTKHYRCQSHAFHKAGLSRPNCDQIKFISEHVIETWLDARLKQAIALDAPDFLANGHSATGQIATLEAQIASVEARIRRAIQHQMDVDAADRLYSIYADEINRENADLKAHRAALDDLMRRALSSGRESRDRAQAFRELQNITLDSFWNAEPREINQLLHRLLGRRRLVVLAGQVVGIADTPRRKG